MGGTSRDRRYPVALGLCALFALGILIVGSSATSGSMSAASGGEPEMALNLVWGGLCDDAVRPTECTVNNGSQFLLTIDAVAWCENSLI